MHSSWREGKKLFIRKIGILLQMVVLQKQVLIKL
jgi:hypothetical protein